MTGNVIIKCPSCGARNRVAAGKAATAVCGRCKAALPELSDKPVVVTDSNFADTVGGTDLPVLLDLWAEWCGPCRMIAPIVEKLAREFAGRAVVGKLDVDRNPATAARFGVQSIPTLLILKDGKEVDRLVGLQPEDAIARRLSRFIP